MRALFFGLLLLAGTAVAEGESASSGATLTVGGVPSAPPCREVKVPTPDGLTLVADHCPAREAGAPVAILLHMIPPHHDRTNYSRAVRSQLVDAGIEVLNLDRRGGGDSPGVAKEAYTGPKGIEDVQGAVDWLRAHSKADLSKWACVGASNGTTTCLDYAVAAAEVEGRQAPTALVFLTGGGYTENQNALKGSVVEHLPVLFTYGDDEKDWSEAQKAYGNADLWRFQKYVLGGHGTKLFDRHPEAVRAVADFLTKELGSTPVSRSALVPAE